MRLLSLILGALLIVLISTKVSAAPQPSRRPASETCRIRTGYGTAIAQGKTKKEAKEKARLKCGTSMIDDYFKQRQNIPEDRIDDLALACVNLECE